MPTVTTLFPIVLAAGQGTRMRSALPKVLHPVAGKPMLQHVVDACNLLIGTRQITVVYGHGGEQVMRGTQGENLAWVLQEQQLGTGHAVKQAMPNVLKYAQDDTVVLIAYGDVPLIRPQTLQLLANSLKQSTLSILTTRLDNPTGYGRMVRNHQRQVQAIVEEKDATDEQRLIQEVNTGFMAARAKDFARWLDQLSPKNSQGEYYLTDCVSLAVAEGGQITTVLCTDPLEVEGANNRAQLARLEREAQRRQSEVLMLSGVTVADPTRLDIRGQVTAGQDCFIDVNVVLLGHVELGANVTIDSGCVLKNVKIADNVHVKSHTLIEDAVLGEHCEVGPFARIRPGTVLGAGAKVGNFVETKKAQIGKNSKVSHLSYIGDTDMGEDVNIGAGTITCNYDGVNKFKTIIGDRVFVGSNSQLVAPVMIENDATIGAGSTITKTAPAGKLTVSRARQITIEGWQRPVKEKK